MFFSYWAKAQDTYELSVYLNEHIANIVNRYPKKFIGPWHCANAGFKTRY